MINLSKAVQILTNLTCDSRHNNNFDEIGIYRSKLFFYFQNTDLQFGQFGDPLYKNFALCPYNLKLLNDINSCLLVNYLILNLC